MSAITVAITDVRLWLQLKNILTMPRRLASSEASPDKKISGMARFSLLISIVSHEGMTSSGSRTFNTASLAAKRFARAVATGSELLSHSRSSRCVYNRWL